MSINQQFYKNSNSDSYSEFGITSTTIADNKFIFNTINPFAIFTELKNIQMSLTFPLFVQSILLNELTTKNSSKFNEVRTVTNMIPGFPSVPTGIIDNRIRNGESNITLRQKLPISLCLWIPLHLIAFDSLTRTLFQTSIGKNVQLPTLLKELFLRTRTSVLGSFNVAPAIDEEQCDLFYKDHPYLENTFLDYKYLRTQEGISNYISFLVLLSQTSDYVKTFNSEIILNLSFASGFQITQLAITIANDEFDSIQIMQGNSFPNGSPTFVHSLDAIISRQKTVNKDGTYQVTTFSPKQNFTGITPSSVAKWIVSRSLGLTTNSSYPHEHSPDVIIDDQELRRPNKPIEHVAKTKQVKLKPLKRLDYKLRTAKMDLILQSINLLLSKIELFLTTTVKANPDLVTTP